MAQHPHHKDHPEHDPKKPIREKPRGGQAMTMTAGGVSWPASFTGWAVAFLVGLVISAIVGAILAAIGATTQAITGVGIAGGIVGLITWFVAFFIGGWTAGRVAKMNGLLQGFVVWIIGLVFLIILLILAAIIGPSVALIGGLSIPAVGNLVTVVGLGTILLLIVQLIGSLLGGWLATRSMQRM